MAQEWSLARPAPQAPPRGRGAIVSGVVLLVVGAVLLIAGIVGFATSASGLVSGLGSTRTTPTTFAQTLDAGTTYAVYERASSGSGTTDDPYLGNVGPGDVTVTAPDGTAVPVADSPGLSRTVSGSYGTYVVVATFDPPVSGTYDITISTEGSTVVVAPSLTSIGRILPWVALAGLGVLLGLVGGVVVIVGIVLRSSSRPAPAAVPGYSAPPGTGAGYPAPTPYAAPTTVAPATPVLPPRGWYADPERPGGQRYWDGAAWTEHRA